MDENNTIQALTVSEEEVVKDLTETTVAETETPAVVESGKATELVSEGKSLGKDLVEMGIVMCIIYAFCKLMDFIIDKVKAGVKKLKEKRAEKKAQKKQQAASEKEAPVAKVEKPEEVQGVATEK